MRPDGFVFAPVNTLAEKLFCAVKLASFGLFPRVSNPFPDSIWGEREREREQVNWGGDFPPFLTISSLALYSSVIVAVAASIAV